MWVNDYVVATITEEELEKLESYFGSAAGNSDGKQFGCKAFNRRMASGELA